MIQILENGKYRVIICACGCKYSFSTTDVEEGIVPCPECGAKNTAPKVPAN